MPYDLGTILHVVFLEFLYMPCDLGTILHLIFLKFLYSERLRIKVEFHETNFNFYSDDSWKA